MTKKDLTVALTREEEMALREVFLKEMGDITGLSPEGTKRLLADVLRAPKMDHPTPEEIDFMGFTLLDHPDVVDALFADEDFRNALLAGLERFRNSENNYDSVPISPMPG